MNNGYGQPQHYQQYSGGGYPPQQQQWQQQPDYQQHQMPPQHQQWQQQPRPYDNQGQQQYQRPTPLPNPMMGRGALMPGYPPMPPGVHPGMSPGLMSPGMQRPGYMPMMPNYNPPSPPPSPEEDDRDPRLDDPWLIEFTKRTQKTQADDDSEWSAVKIKARLREIQETIQKLKTLQTQMSEGGADHSEEAKSLMAKLDELFGTFNPSDPALERFKNRLKKNKKHKAWLRKARARVKSDKKNKTQKTAIMNRLIDEWQSKLIAKDVSRRKGDEERKQKKLLEKQRQLEKKEATHLHDVLLKLEELRALRAQTLELEGQQVSTTPLERVLEQYIKDNPITEEAKKVETEEADKGDEEGKDKEGEEDKGEKEGEGEGEDEGEDESAEPKPITEEDVRKYYEQAFESIDRLVAVRRAWDQFVVPAGFGTRIPPSFITPPTPTRGWRKYLKKKKPAPSTPPSDISLSTTTDTVMESAADAASGDN